MIYHLFFYLIWKVVKKYKTFFWESGVWYNLSRSVHTTETANVTDNYQLCVILGCRLLVYLGISSCILSVNICSVQIHDYIHIVVIKYCFSILKIYLVWMVTMLVFMFRSQTFALQQKHLQCKKVWNKATFLNGKILQTGQHVCGWYGKPVCHA